MDRLWWKSCWLCKCDAEIQTVDPVRLNNIKISYQFSSSHVRLRDRCETDINGQRITALVCLHILKAQRKLWRSVPLIFQCRQCVLSQDQADAIGAIDIDVACREHNQLVGGLWQEEWLLTYCNCLPFSDILEAIWDRSACVGVREAWNLETQWICLYWWWRVDCEIGPSLWWQRYLPDFQVRWALLRVI